MSTIAGFISNVGNQWIKQTTFKHPSADFTSREHVNEALNLHHSFMR
jgi:hypothetical protein